MRTLTLVEASHYEWGHLYLVETTDGEFYICVYDGLCGPFLVMYGDMEFCQEDIACVYELPKRGEQ